MRIQTPAAAIVAKTSLRLLNKNTKSQLETSTLQNNAPFPIGKPLKFSINMPLFARKWHPFPGFQPYTQKFGNGFLLRLTCGPRVPTRRLETQTHLWQSWHARSLVALLLDFIYTPKPPESLIKTSQCHRFYTPFTRLLTYRYKMCGKCLPP
jgi:hypothetical protein